MFPEKDIGESMHPLLINFLTSYGTPLYFPPKVASTCVFMEIITGIITSPRPSPRFKNKKGIDDVDKLEDDLENDSDTEDDEEDEFATDEEEEEDDEEESEI